ncbi:MAG: single-stranded DNA-binding protein [Desulfurococcales archaeon ex4484_58]|nr:MAG: single-stranded DNA-binding protein [Desulfurococcales archaeon ex4484_58]
MNESEKESKPVTKIIDLKPHSENVSVKGRVIEASPPRTINTRRGIRTISNAIIGDESGRVQTTLWGSKAGSLKEGEAVEIHGAWTSSFRGKVQLNIGRSTEVKILEDSEAPKPDEIPEDEPSAPEENYRRRPMRGRRFRGRR